MKRSMVIGGAAAGMLTVVCGWAVAGLKGSKHDFSTAAWVGAGFDQCGVCHTPANEKPPTVPPLWDSRADLTRRFGRFAVSESTPGMGTLSCLRCHDGTIAKDATGAVHQERFVHKQNPGMFTTGHGRSDHPVGVAYPKIAKGYYPLPTVLSGWKVRLPDGKVECASCHDPHDNAGQPHMLVMSNARSALCLKCHKK